MEASDDYNVAMTRMVYTPEQQLQPDVLRVPVQTRLATPFEIPMPVAVLSVRLG